MFRRYALSILCCIFVTGTFAEQFQPLEAEISPGFLPGESGLESGLWMQIERLEKDTRNSPRRIRDEAINQYLHDIVCRLSPDYCNDIRIYITRVPFFNASMAPNGMMTVWTGLLLRVHNEAQLAAILGHELGHYLRKHSLDRFEDAKIKSNIGMLLGVGLGFGGVLLSSSGGNPGIFYDTNEIAQFVLIASRFAHSRSGEREADKFGIQLMAQAGYDPFEAARVWKNIVDEDEAAKHKKTQGSLFFATHPDPENRLKTLDSYARSLTIDEEDKGEQAHERFIQYMAPYWRTILEDELRLNQLGKTEFILNNLIANNVVPGVIHFYKGELYRLRKEEGDVDLARQHYEQALQFDYYLPETYRSLGLLHLKGKRPQDAMEYLRLYLDKSPEAKDREMIEFYLTME